VTPALLLAAALGAGDAGYTVGRAEAPRATLLGPGEEAWSKAERIAWGPEKYETAFRALWDEKDAVFTAWSPPGQPSFHVPAAFRDFVYGASGRGRVGGR